jgi:hypothetical protein
MLRHSALQLTRLASFPIWRRRAQSLHRHSGPHVVSGPHWNSAKRRRMEPDDPTAAIPLSAMTLLRCPNCGRVKMVPPEQSSHFHSCCEVYEMRAKGNMKRVGAVERMHRRLLSYARSWDVERGRPRSNPQRPMNKATSKRPK